LSQMFLIVPDILSAEFLPATNQILSIQKLP